MHQYKYPRPAVSVDILVPRQIDGKLHLLLILRKHAPFQGCWALPGGFMEIDESLETAAARELKEETGLVAESMRQVATFSRPDRDPRSRVITAAFEASVSADQTPVADDDAQGCQWVEVETLKNLAFDHDEIISVWSQWRTAYPTTSG